MVKLQDMIPTEDLKEQRQAGQDWLASLFAGVVLVVQTFYMDYEEKHSPTAFLFSLWFLQYAIGLQSLCRAANRLFGFFFWGTYLMVMARVRWPLGLFVFCIIAAYALVLAPYNAAKSVYRTAKKNVLRMQGTAYPKEVTSDMKWLNIAWEDFVIHLPVSVWVMYWSYQQHPSATVWIAVFAFVAFMILVTALVRDPDVAAAKSAVEKRQRTNGS